MVYVVRFRYNFKSILCYCYQSMDFHSMLCSIYNSPYFLISVFWMKSVIWWICWVVCISGVYSEFFTVVRYILMRTVKIRRYICL